MKITSNGTHESVKIVAVVSSTAISGVPGWVRTWAFLTLFKSSPKTSRALTLSPTAS